MNKMDSSIAFKTYLKYQAIMALEIHQFRSFKNEDFFTNVQSAPNCCLVSKEKQIVIASS